MKKVLLVGLVNDSNLGDPIICESVEYLYSQIRHNDKLIRMDIDEPFKNTFYERLIRKFHISFNISPSRILERKYKKYFRDKVYDSSLILFVGGGLIKFKNQYFYGIKALLELADEYNIPVAMNAVGVEGFDSNNKKCISIKEAIQTHSLKYISTRDDLDTLVNKYFDSKPHILYAKVADPAVWIAEKYNIKRNQNSNVIGIGIGDFTLFERYGKEFSKEDVLKIYVELILALLQNGKNVELFTNGLHQDNCSLFEVKENVENKNFNINYHIPSSSEDLVKCIANYQAIIATRMHSCIIAYSLEVPSVGFVWNDKIKMFGQNIDSTQNFITVDNLKTEYVLSQLSKVILEEYDQKKRTAFRNSAIRGIKDICSLITE